MGATDSSRCPKFITDYIEILRARFSVQTVILFGSRARGVHDQFSDWDLFVIASHLADWKERLKDIWKDKPPGVDVIAWTPDEVRRYIYRTFILDIATEGVPLYGDMTWMRELAAQHRARQKTVQPEKEGRPAAAQL